MQPRRVRLYAPCYPDPTGPIRSDKRNWSRLDLMMPPLSKNKAVRYYQTLLLNHALKGADIRLCVVATKTPVAAFLSELDAMDENFLM